MNPRTTVAGAGAGAVSVSVAEVDPILRIFVVSNGRWRFGGSLACFLS